MLFYYRLTLDYNCFVNLQKIIKHSLFVIVVF